MPYQQQLPVCEEEIDGATSLVVDTCPYQKLHPCGGGEYCAMMLRDDQQVTVSLGRSLYRFMIEDPIPAALRLFEPRQRLDHRRAEVGMMI